MAAHITAHEPHPLSSRYLFTWLALAVFLCLLNSRGDADTLSDGLRYTLRPQSNRAGANTAGYNPPCLPGSHSSPAVRAQAAGADTPLMTINIDYLAPGSASLAGAVCQSFPLNLRPAFEAGARMWAQALYSPSPVTIAACYGDLGTGGPVAVTNITADYRDFPGAPLPNTCYPAAEANALAGYDLNGSAYEAQITLNSRFTYYPGSDGVFDPAAGLYDLMTVAGHEAGHALGFAGTMEVIPQGAGFSLGNGKWGLGGYPSVYDRFVVDGEGHSLLDANRFPNDSPALLGALTGGAVFFNGPAARRANHGQPVKLYAPGTFRPGASYQHLDESFGGSPNQLMIPYPQGAAWVSHTPGGIEIGMMRDLGWPEPSMTQPALLAPTGAGLPLQPTFTWSEVPLAEFYELQISRSPAFDSIDARAQPASAAYTLTTPLLPQKEYFWRVRAWRGSRLGEYSNPASFTTLPAPNPVPIISSLGPDHIITGSGDFKLQVFGRGFISGSTVQWEGQVLNTRLINDSQLEASVPGGYITSAKTAHITIETPGPGGGISAESLLTIQAPALSGDCSYVQDFSVSPESPSTAQDVSIYVNIRSSFPAFRAARLSVIGRDNLGTFSTFNTTLNWNTRATPEGDYTLLLEIDPIGSSWDTPARCTRSYHLDPRPVQPAPLAAVSSFLPDAPQPVLVSISPAAVTARSRDFTLQVSGAGFSAASRIRWNDYELPTTYIDDAHLRAEIPAGYILEHGSASITIFTPAPGGGLSNPLTLTIAPPPDQEPPLLSWDSPVSDGKIAYPRDEVIRLHVVFRDLSGMQRIDMYRWDALNQTFQPILFVMDDPISASLDVRTLNLGWNQVFARGYDPYGNAASTYFWIYRAGSRSSPRLTGFSPEAVQAGSSGTTIAISGTNFAPDSIARLNGVALTTTFITDSSLSAWAPAELLRRSGAWPLEVVTPAPSGGTSNAINLMINPTGECSPDFRLYTGYTDIFSNGGPGSTDRINNYLPDASAEPGPEYTYLYLPEVSGPVQFVLSRQSARLKLLVLDGSNGQCSSSSVIQSDFQVVTLDAEAGRPYYVVVDGEVEEPSPYTLQVEAVQSKPTLADTSPRAVSASAPLFSVHGSGFTTASKVLLNGVALQTYFIHDTQLLARLPEDFAYPPGDYSLIVTNPQPGGGSSDPLILKVEAGNFPVWIPAVLNEKR